MRLGIPLYACDPALAGFGTKSGSRRAFRDAGVPLPDGSEGLRNLDELYAALTALKQRHPSIGDVRGRGLAIGIELVSDGAAKTPELALKAAETLEAEGVPTRVVSVPCFELFEQQPKAYQDAVIGRGTVRVAVEAAIKQGWERFIGEDGGFVGMTGFGASAPAEVLYREFGITAEAVVEAAKARL